jgi:undecaprenyl-diphosphatase
VSDSLHLDPPTSPRSLLLSHPALVWVVAGISLLLAIAAAVDGGSLLLVWDEPIQRWVESRRTDDLETVFRSFSRMGSNIVVFASFAVILAVVARRCRVLALALAVAVLTRPLFEFVIKDVIARDRPDILRLVEGTGFSHPSGHVLAAVTLWGLLPAVVGLLTDRRWIWWIASVTAAVLIVGISASRVYLGVHWFSDIVQGLLLGWLFLTLVEMRYVHVHRVRGCGDEGRQPSTRWSRSRWTW